MSRVLVTGAAGFIGHHLCRFLKERGHWVRAVDYKPPQYESVADEGWWECDLRKRVNAFRAIRGIDDIYHLAADMGGMGYIGVWHLDILIHNLLINANMARAVQMLGADRLFFSSSACVYPERLQTALHTRALVEGDAWQGQPDTAYGVEKLTAEELFLRLGEALDTHVRIARFHNIYGPECTWMGGREKAPAALCRKIAEAKREGHSSIEIWGDGQQSRSFCHISDCLEMIYWLMHSDYEDPLNIGTDVPVTVNALADIIAQAAGVQVGHIHVPGPEGVRDRNADLTWMRYVLDYEPQVTLEQGMAELYQWVETEYAVE